MTIVGSGTVALLEILGVVGESLHRLTRGVDLALETEGWSCRASFRG
jgi:hypothetical protein